MTIVYTSETGHTARYATMLGDLCNKPVMTLDEALKTLDKKADIVYLGWFQAGKIVGLKKAKRRFHLRAVAGVGIRPDVENMNQVICKMKGVPEGGGFFLQGGYDPEKLEGGKKKALTMVLKVLSKKINQNENPSPKEKRLLYVFEHGGSFVDKQYIVAMKNYVKKLS